MGNGFSRLLKIKRAPIETVRKCSCYALFLWKPDRRGRQNFSFLKKWFFPMVAIPVLIRIVAAFFRSGQECHRWRLFLTPLKVPNCKMFLIKDHSLTSWCETKILKLCSPPRVGVPMLSTAVSEADVIKKQEQNN